MRGAGPNSGVVTSFDFRLHPLDHPITFGAVEHPIERARELAAPWRDLAENGPDELFLSFGLARAGDSATAYITAPTPERPTRPSVTSPTCTRSGRRPPTRSPSGRTSRRST